MSTTLSRRNLLKLVSVALPAGAASLSAGRLAPETALAADGDPPVSDAFPSHPPELVREMVTVAHFDLRRVKELCGSRPSLANATWDWGFGDWESALGAASHMGNRAIAEFLISRGARPSLFSAAMLGQLDVVKAFLSTQPDLQQIRGPHSISLLAHARMGGQAARPVFEFLQSLGGADMQAPVPLPEGEGLALLGSYVFGLGVTQHVEVTLPEPRMYAANKMYTYPPQLIWTREGTMARPLFHLGERAFYPAGAPSVRIRFLNEADGMLMAVQDPEPVLTARQKR